jgi:tripartite-type tricarboxylate transporter receptor subunit TctC
MDNDVGLRVMMKFIRQRPRFPALQACAAFAAFGARALPGAADAQMYPAKLVRVIVPVTPGGNVDLITRTTAKKLTDALGQPVRVDNRPGGSSVIGSGFVAKTAPDGYALMMAHIDARLKALQPGIETYTASKLAASRPIDERMLKSLRDNCDVVINALGD